MAASSIAKIDLMKMAIYLTLLQTRCNNYYSFSSCAFFSARTIFSSRLFRWEFLCRIFFVHDKNNRKRDFTHIPRLIVNETLAGREQWTLSCLGSFPMLRSFWLLFDESSALNELMRELPVCHETNCLIRFLSTFLSLTQL